MTGSPHVSRRGFLSAGAAAGLVAFSGSATGAGPLLRPEATPETVARDQAFWAEVAANYRVTDKVTNLENGYWGIMAAPVLRAYQANSERLNRDSTYYARRDLKGDVQRIRARLAEFIGVGADEVTFTRGASESLQNLIGGYNRLGPGDAVLYADLDYSAMKSAMRWLADRRGVEVVKIAIPEPASRAAVIETYARAFEAHPNLRMVLLTHLNNLTGLITPVREIAAMARARGIDVILDAAHSLGQVDFRIDGMGCDFIGFNLHKWIGAPIGCGAIYIRRDRIADIDTYMGETAGGRPEIDARVHTGTYNFAALLTIPDALDFHIAIGTPYKEARLRYLRDVWVKEVRGMAGLEILTPDDPAMVAGLTSFRIKGRISTGDNNALVKTLTDDHGVLTVRRTGPAAGDCVRATPALYNSKQDALRLARALRAVVPA